MNVTKHDVILELASFPFLFQHGHDIYDGKMKLNKYLKYRMSTLFSPFKMYEPYLLCIYDLKQSFITDHRNIINMFANIIKIKLKNPSLDEHGILKNFIKYNCLHVYTRHP
jgi:hypothetical protein